TVAADSLLAATSADSVESAPQLLDQLDVEPPVCLELIARGVDTRLEDGHGWQGNRAPSSDWHTPCLLSATQRNGRHDLVSTGCPAHVPRGDRLLDGAGAAGCRGRG